MSARGSAAEPSRGPAPVELSFFAGTLELRGLAQGDPRVPEAFRWDERSACLRAPAMAYAESVRALHGQVELLDRARGYSVLEPPLRVRREPRPFQREALEAWLRAQGRGVVVLPTGAGKSHVAVMAIDAKRRSALVVAPTLDLVRQWHALLRRSFGEPVGLIGGGSHDPRPLTVTTYDSAYLHMDHLGARYGLVVFDECHHLPSASYALSAKSCLAPFRLGLTATPERADERELELSQLIGPVIYRKDITELSGSYLASYDTERIIVELTQAEREEHDAERALYLAFVRQQGLRLGSPDGWQQFLRVAMRSEPGRRAFRAHRRQRELAFAAHAKLELVEQLLDEHRGGRVIVFTQDNATAYEVARRCLLPIITHQTKLRERAEILERFSEGEYGAVVTSKVLNEGVDVPDANVAIVLSGSGSVREHVQRLGRVLRQRDGKRAVLYELVSGGTGETSTSDRRREHSAYR